MQYFSFNQTLFKFWYTECICDSSNLQHTKEMERTSINEIEPFAGALGQFVAWSEVYMVQVVKGDRGQSPTKFHAYI